MRAADLPVRDAGVELQKDLRLDRSEPERFPDLRGLVLVLRLDDARLGVVEEAVG